MYSLFKEVKEYLLLSDHMPVMGLIGMTPALTWNILCKMQFNRKWSYYNNGFKCVDEPIAQYENRLEHIASQISMMAYTEKPAFICLQECPENGELREFFSQKLLGHTALRDYQIQYYNNDQDEYHLMTLYDARLYQVHEAMTAEISAMPLREGLSGRVLPLVFENKLSKKKQLIINVHANFSLEIKHDVMALYHCAESCAIHHVTFMGDFNRDLVLKVDDRSKVDISDAVGDGNCLEGVMYTHASRDASFCARYNETPDQVVETRDGFISTQPIEMVCMTRYNQPAASLGSKSISAALSAIPVGFLENLSRVYPSDGLGETSLSVSQL